jgi:GntR family transcriptional regulator
MNSTSKAARKKLPSRNGEFSFSLENVNGIPIYRQIIQQIEYGILGQRLIPGDKLPTIRALAVELKANPNTIAKAYNELEIRGILITQVGSGTYISGKKPEGIDALREEKIQKMLDHFVAAMKALGVEKGELIERLEGATNE